MLSLLLYTVLMAEVNNPRTSRVPRSRTPSIQEAHCVTLQNITPKEPMSYWQLGGFRATCQYFLHQLSLLFIWVRWHTTSLSKIQGFSQMHGRVLSFPGHFNSGFDSFLAHRPHGVGNGNQNTCLHSISHTFSSVQRPGELSTLSSTAPELRSLAFSAAFWMRSLFQCSYFCVMVQSPQPSLGGHTGSGTEVQWLYLTAWPTLELLCDGALRLAFICF